MTWREEVRLWHPGQDRNSQAGGFGVLDPGINALSIASHMLPHPLFVERGGFDIPANCAALIAARIDFRDAAGAPIAMDLDLRQEGERTWTIAVAPDAGALRLVDGGPRLILPDDAIAAPVEQPEYPASKRASPP